MKAAPPLSLDRIAARISELYGFATRSLIFIPEGEVSYAFRVEGADSRVYFLKLWPDNRQGKVMREKLLFILPILQELSAHRLVSNLPSPVQTTQGTLSAAFDGYTLALFPFIEGRPLSAMGDPLTTSTIRQVAETMANLHRAGPLLSTPLPGESAFEVSFSAGLISGLTALEAVNSQHSPGQVHLKTLLLPRRAPLLRSLDRLTRLQQQARQSARRLVVCHTDMGGNNVLVDPAGRVHILDWDDLTLAPPEHDLHEYRGEALAAFLELYIQAGGVPEIFPEQFEFYLLRRYLADLADWMLRILYESAGPEQDQSDLYWIETYCLRSLETFDREQAEIARAVLSVFPGQ